MVASACALRTSTSRGTGFTSSREGAETKTGCSRKVSIPAKLKPYLESLPKTGPWLFTAPPGRKYPQGGHGINTKHLNEDFEDLDADRRQGGAEDGRVLNPPSQIAHQHRLMEPRETFGKGSLFEACRETRE